MPDTCRIEDRFLAEKAAGGYALWSHPGSGYAYWQTGPSFHTDVRVAGPEDFKPDPDRPGVMVATYNLPDWSLSS